MPERWNDISCFEVILPDFQLHAAVTTGLELGSIEKINMFFNPLVLDISFSVQHCPPNPMIPNKVGYKRVRCLP